MNSVLWLLGLWILVFYLWRDYRLDSFRDHVFSIRDELFLYAAKQNIKFHDPAYTILRDRMNASLRYAHEFTMTRLLLVSGMHEPQKSPFLVKWEASVRELPEATQMKMREINVRYNEAMLQHVIYLSFLRYLVLRPVAVFNRLLVREAVESATIESSVERLESDALQQDAHRLGRSATAAV